MDMQTALLAAVGALWTALQAGTLGALRWLLQDRKEILAVCVREKAEMETKFTAELARKDAKLDEAASLATRQAASQQHQIELQQRTIEALQAALGQRPPA